MQGELPREFNCTPNRIALGPLDPRVGPKPPQFPVHPACEGSIQQWGARSKQKLHALSGHGYFPSAGGCVLRQAGGGPGNDICRNAVPASPGRDDFKADLPGLTWGDGMNPAN
jgi:hypothetical protein